MTTNEVVKVDDVIQTLYRMGMDEFRIAAATRQDVKYVKSRLRSLTTSTKFANPEDTDLANAMRNLAWKAYEEALVTIQVGSPGERLGLIKTILGRTASMVGAETTTAYDDMRNDFDEMMTRLRSEPDDDIIDAELIPSTTSIDTYDRD